MPSMPAQPPAAGAAAPAPTAAANPRRLAWTAGGLACALAAAGCAGLPGRRGSGPPFGGPPPAEPLAMAGDWSWLCLAALAGLLLGGLGMRLWRARRLRRALARPQGLILPAEVGRLRAALTLIDDLVLLWQERDRLGGVRQNHAPAGDDPAGAVVGGDKEGGARPGGRPPAP